MLPNHTATPGHTVESVVMDLTISKNQIRTVDVQIEVCQSCLVIKA
jgi:hypothetical protein